MTKHVNNVTSTVEIVMGPLPAGFIATAMYGFVEFSAYAAIPQQAASPFTMADGSDGLMAARAQLLRQLAAAVEENQPNANAIINVTIATTVVGSHVHIVASGQTARILRDS